MPVRFQADADFNQIIVSAVVRRSPQIDFRTATAAGLAGISDAEVLAISAREGRVLIVVPQSLSIREVADTLILIWTATAADEWTNRIVYLPI